MAYLAPQNVTIDGNPAEDFPVRTLASEDPRPSIRADNQPNSSESGSRRQEVDWGTDPEFGEGNYTTSIDIDGFKSKNNFNHGRVVVPTDQQWADGITLEPDTEYFYRTYVRRNNGTIGSPYVYGSFITPRVPDTPTITTPGNEAELPISVPTQKFSWTYSHPDSGRQIGSYFRWRLAGTPEIPATESSWTEYIQYPFVWDPFPPPEGTLLDWVSVGECWEENEDWGNDPRSPASEDYFVGGPCGELTTGGEGAFHQQPNEANFDLTLFPQNQRIEWQVRTIGFPWWNNYPLRRMYASEWSDSFYFTVVGPTTAPSLVDPVFDEAVVASQPRLFEWVFRDPIPESFTSGTILEYREVGTADWIRYDFDQHGYPDDGFAGSFWEIEAGTFEVGKHYEWHVATRNDRNEWSPFSEPATFWAITTPGGGNPGPIVGEPLGALGCGTHRAFIYDRGGEVRRGEVTQLVRVKWERRRDDISEASILVNDWDEDCGALLSSVRSWMHELVIFREHPSGMFLERVWEGPVTRVTYRSDQVEIAAHDCMVYVYRRILRRGFNDAYRLSQNDQQLGLKTVVYRSRWIIMNALAYDDPNLLPYLTALERTGDARTSRVVPEYQSSAWEQVDDMAATAGLDYTTVGRRIILNDTHQPVGVLPEMRDGDFGDDPIVSEYGMQLANYYAVTNNNGVWGAADRFNAQNEPDYYGYIEMIASAYGEAEGAVQEVNLTPAAKAALRQTLTEQAERNIGGRWPTPLIVRVPDNTTLNPEVEVGINQLVPGVWMPVRSVNTLRPVTQMQKLDNVTVTEEKGKETITVTLSPAPSEGVDAEPTPGEGVI